MKKIFDALFWVAGGVYIAALIYYKDELKINFSSIFNEPSYIIVILVILIISSTILRAEKFRLLLKNLFATNLSGVAFKIYFPAFFFCLVPGRMTEIFRGKLLIDRAKLSLPATALLIITDKITDVLGLGIVGSILLFMFLSQDPTFLYFIQTNIRPELFVYLAGTFLCVLFLIIFLRHKIRSVLGRYMHINVKDRSFPTLIVMSIFAWLPEVVSFYFLFLLLGIPNVSYDLMMGSYAIATIFGGFSPLPAGAVGFEASLYGLLYNFVKTENLIGIILLHRALTILCGLSIGVVFYCFHLYNEFRIAR